ncbi:MAG: DNA helicase UvrD [Verrucomicrobia bacterium]|nr:DNA helicase UvrD [Verrucomicrobiota bacterium]
MLNLTALNPPQRLAVETIEGPVLILAGAGTGKTRVITHRIAHMMEKGIPPRQILGVTFTNKAAREMQERVRQLTPRANDQTKDGRINRPTVCTFHSLCVRILREHIERLGYKKNFVIYDEHEQLAAVKKILSRISARGEKTDPKLILAQLSRSKSGIAMTDSSTDESTLAMAVHVLPQYDSTLRACNAVDFDDLILLTLRLFREHPETLKVSRARYRYVMVDEYQDTNAAQFQLVQFLTQEHRNFCVVGDDDQSIYGFRGAEIANLLNLEKYFPEVKVIKLEQNYRSTNVILAAANALIKHNSRRRGKNLWSQKGRGSNIILHTFANDEAEARTIVEEIEYARKIKRIPWPDQAILFRTNLQSRPIETALRQAGVRYHLIGGQSFFDRREVKDFLAYLKVFINPHDDVNLLRIANVPPRGLSDATMQRFLASSIENKGSVYSAMKAGDALLPLTSKARESAASFARWIEATQSRLRSEAGGSLRAWAERFIAEIEYTQELRRSEKDPESAENRIRNLQDLLGTLEDAPASGPQRFEQLQSFLEDLTLDREHEEDEIEGQAVTLITMHSCKGLEFPHVYVVGLEDGLLPHTRSVSGATLEEERRLFYVAITRAMQSLTLSYCLGRRKYGEVQPCHPSRFLQELPSDLIEAADKKGKQPVSVESGKDLFAGMRSSLD